MVPRFRCGFRIVGPVRAMRRLVDTAEAFRGYAGRLPEAESHRGGYLSVFDYSENFRTYLRENNSCRGYEGEICAMRIPFDIDRAGDLDAALGDFKGRSWGGSARSAPKISCASSPG